MTWSWEQSTSEQPFPKYKRHSVEDWRRAVYRARGTMARSNGVRVLLLYLADHMRGNLTVSVSRRQIADALAIPPGEVTSRIKAARNAGMLDLVESARGQRCATYAATCPGAW